MLRRPGVLAALACGCALAAVALWFAANDLAAGRELDATLRDGIYGLFPNLSRELLRGARSLADTLPFAIGAAALVALAWLRGGRPFALCAALVLLAANVVTQLVQPALAGVRHVDLGAARLHFAGSWPSGHAVAAMLLALGAIVVASPRLRPVTALVGVAYALGVGGALVALGTHLPSDVLAGYLVAGAFTAAGAAAYAALRHRAVPAPKRAPRSVGSARSPLVAPALGALAALAVLATGVGKALVTRRDEVAHAIDNVPLALGATAALAVVVALGAGAALALRR
jgi:membrane-associated phospholipid phosphatase